MLLLLVVLNVKTRRRVIVLAPSLSSPPNSIYQIRQIEKHFCIPTQQIPYHFFCFNCRFTIKLNIKTIWNRELIQDSIWRRLSELINSNTLFSYVHTLVRSFMRSRCVDRGRACSFIRTFTNSNMASTEIYCYNKMLPTFCINTWPASQQIA